jgi:hypothetical protein
MEEGEKQKAGGGREAESEICVPLEAIGSVDIIFPTRG